MKTVDSHWEKHYCEQPMRDSLRQFAEMGNSRYRMQYLETVLGHCPRGARALETGVGTGFDSIWLSLRGVEAHGIDTSRRRSSFRIRLRRRIPL